MKPIQGLVIFVCLLMLAACGSKHEPSEEAIDPGIIYKPLPLHVTKSKNRKPKYLVIHYTAGKSSKPGNAESLYDVFVSKTASADFAVDDKYMVQFNPDIDNYYCWAVGGAKKKGTSGASLYRKANNKNTIHIEICSNLKFGSNESVANHSGWSFSDASLENAAKLAKIIMKKYDIPIENVIRHYDVTGKLCPGIIGWNDEGKYSRSGKKTKGKNTSEEWQRFKQKLMD